MSAEPQPIEHDATQKARRGRWPLVLGLLGLAYLATGLYTVRTKERAVVQRCGRALKRIREPGLHFGFPYGIDRVRRLKVLETKRVGVAMSLADRALGRRGDPQQAECLTGDRNLIRVSAVVQYTISNSTAYLFHVADVPALVRNVAAAELSRIVAGMGVDDVLTVRRDTIRAQAQVAIQAALDRYGAGVMVMEVLVPSDGVAPPPEVSDAFADVDTAREDQHRAISRAQGDAERVTARARGEADATVQDAKGYAYKAVKEAEGDAARFLKEAAQLSEGRELTFKRLILETMEEVLPRVRKIVLDAKARKALDLGIIEAKE